MIGEHSTIGLVVTTDGSFSEIPRENYVPAEQRVIEELRRLASRSLCWSIQRNGGGTRESGLRHAAKPVSSGAVGGQLHGTG